MKKIFSFLILSCLGVLCGGVVMAASGSQAVKVDAVRSALTNKAPGGMDKQKFLDALESCNVVTVQELLNACAKSMPADVACKECEIFIRGIVAEHNNSVSVVMTPVIIDNTDNNNGVVQKLDGSQNNVISAGNTDNNKSGDDQNSNETDNSVSNQPSDNQNTIGDSSGDQNNSGGADTQPKTFKSVCDADGGQYSSGKKSYNDVHYEGEYCKANTGCVKLYANSGITVKGIILDKSQTIYCFAGTEENKYSVPVQKPNTSTTPKTTYCMFGGNRWANGIKTEKVTCNPDDPFADNARGNCTCTCNNGKWNCKKTVASAENACMLGSQSYASGSEVEIDCNDAPANKSSLTNGLKCKCNCYNKAWGCHLSKCKSGYDLIKHSYGYECKKSVCAGVDKAKFEKVEEENGKCKLTCPYGQVLNKTKTGCGPRYDKLFGSRSDYL